MLRCGPPAHGADGNRDAAQGHGALCKGIVVDDRVTPLWQAFKDLLIDFVPGLVVRVHEKAELMADG